MSFFKKRLTGFVCFFILFLGVVYGTGNAKAEEKFDLVTSFLKYLPEHADMLPSVIFVENFVKENNSLLNDHVFSVSAGFANHSAGEEGDGLGTMTSNLTIGADYTKGFYPNEFNFKAGVFFLFNEGKLTEDMTTLHLSYERHFLPFLEAFVFVDRFSNSYLSIQHRYEMGGGAKFEFQWGIIGKERKKTWQDFKKHIDNVFGKNVKRELIIKELREKKRVSSVATSFYQMLESELERFKDEDKDPLDNIYERLSDSMKHRENLEDGHNNKGYLKFIEEVKSKNTGNKKEKIKEYLAKEKKELEKKTKDIAKLIVSFLKLGVEADAVKWAMKKKYSVFGIGFLFSVINEIERAEINDPTTTSEKTQLDPEQRYRFVFRPNIIFRPTEKLYFRSDVYLKSPFAIFDKDEGDFRIDCYNRLTYELPADLGWAKKILLSLEYQYHFDNDPPVGAKNNKYSKLLFNLGVSI